MKHIGAMHVVRDKGKCMQNGTLYTTEWPTKVHNYGIVNVFPKCISKMKFLYLFNNYHLSDVIILS